jgi:hypothetical protein
LAAARLKKLQRKVKNMESKSKGLTGNTPPSSFEGKTGAKGQQSEQSARTGHTPTNTKTTGKPSKNTLPAEKVRVAADMVRAGLNILEANGLTKRFRLWNKENTKVTRVIVVFDLEDWTDDLYLLSDQPAPPDNTVVKEGE